MIRIGGYKMMQSDMRSNPFVITIRMKNFVKFCANKKGLQTISAKTLVYMERKTRFGLATLSLGS